MAMVTALLNLRSGGVWSWTFPIPVLQGRRGGSHGLCPSDIEEVEECGHGHPHLPFQTEGWEVAFIFLGSGGVPVEWGQS